MKKLLPLILFLLLSCAAAAQDVLYFPHDSTWVDVDGQKKSKCCG